MKKLQQLLDQLRNLDPNDPGRWPLGVRVGTVVLLFLFAALRALASSVLHSSVSLARASSSSGRFAFQTKYQ